MLISASHRMFFAAIILCAWLLLAVCAFWWFQFRYIGSFNNYLAQFNGDLVSHISSENIEGEALVVHIVDPNCPCSRFSNKHIRDLEAQFFETVSFKRWENLPVSFKSLMVIPASPAVAIWSKAGDLAYFGAYTSGAYCGEGDDFVVATLKNLSKGVNPQWVSQDAFGCFCEWI